MNNSENRQSENPVEVASDIVESGETVESKPPVDALQVEHLLPLWSHQKKALEVAKEKFALFFDVGTGKTRTALELLKKHEWVERVLIIAPIQVAKNWPREIEKYFKTEKIHGDGVITVESIPHSIHIISGGGTKEFKISIIKKYCMDKPQDAYMDDEVVAPKPVGRYVRFLIVNIEALRSQDYRQWLGKTNCSMVIIDESHNFKSPTSLQTKGLLDVVGKLRPAYLYLLTGTPAPQSEMDLWTTFRLLGVTDLPFFPWRKKYFEDKNARRFGTRNYWPDYRIRPESKEIFYNYLRGCSITAKKEEVLDLPPLLKTTMYCELSAEQRHKYSSMEEFLFAIDDAGNELNASNLLERSLRLQQLVAGVSPIDSEEMVLEENPRLVTLGYAIDMIEGRSQTKVRQRAEQLATIGAPLPPRAVGDGKASPEDMLLVNTKEPVQQPQFIIWTVFAATYRQIAFLLRDRGISYGTLTGEDKPWERQEFIDQFQAGKLRALICNPKVAGEGINLTAASYSIHYTRTYSLTQDLQCEARSYRGGSERHEKVTRIDIVAENTIDEEIMEALRQKKSVQDFILGIKSLHSKRIAKKREYGTKTKLRFPNRGIRKNKEK